MPFGFGGSKSKNKAQSTGSASSIDFSQSGSVSGGVSSSVSSSLGGSAADNLSVTGSSSRATSSQGIAFEDVFERLFGGAEGAAGGLDTSLLTGAANQLFSGGLDFLDNLRGGADTDFLSARVSGESPVLGEQIGGLSEDIGRFFNQQILPGIQSEAIAGGSLGGSRQGVAEGIAAEGAGREFARGATSLRAADISARDTAAGQLGQQRIAGASAGLGSLGALAGIADFGFGADLAPFERLSALLGGQTVLGQSESVGVSQGRTEGSSTSFTNANAASSAEDFARAFSSSFGASQAQNQSTSSGSSSAISFGSGK